MTTDHTDSHDARQLAILGLFHGERGFSPTDRQYELYEALLSAPCPPDDHDSGADRLTLPGGGDRLTLLGYGGAMGGGKTRHRRTRHRRRAEQHTNQASLPQCANGYPVASKPTETGHWRLNHG